MSRAIASLAAVLFTLRPAFAAPPSAEAARPKAPPGDAVLASGDGFTITVDDYLARFAEQPDAVKARFATDEKRSEFLTNLVRFELLAAEARRQGLDRDPQVLLTLKKVMVQRLVQSRFGGPGDKAEKTKAFDAWLESLRGAANVKLNAEALRALPLDAKVAPEAEAGAPESSTPARQAGE
jgi:hypothetical protein